MKTEIERECESCGATGLYVGMGERDGAAVVCFRCQGTGKETVTVNWTPFKVRKKRAGIKQVYKVNPGIGAAPGVVPGGMPYSDWESGERFPKRGTEMRQHTCPTWWYQAENYERKPEWDECNSSLGATFSQCPRFKDKAKCWERFDREGL